jgi:polyisoprenoid-binding protein YceI
MSNIKWAIDPTHSEIAFKVKHLMITTVTGYFRKYDLEVETETDDFSSVKKIEFSADIDSIDTNNEQRDAHLKSADFFNSEEESHILFSGKSYNVSGDEGELSGDLTIRNITKPITLKVEYGGTLVDPYGQTKAGFTLSGKLSRKEFGLTWSAVTEAGSVVVSDDVKLAIEVQLIKQA